ncbi:nucleotidyltransferase [archaeon CG10_big_fil_rev_8_21_14_0_10_43_11]|nr:MAG: nucleotidyltransferase [archaeon CG10_big_fil_rev_8_21_14_0_10_43_11]
MYEIVLGRTLSDREQFGQRGTILLGKHYVKMGQTLSLSNPVLLDVVKPHVLLIAGKRGGGKSYTMAVMAEGMAKLEKEIFKNISVLMFDPMGIFWTTKYPNFRQDELLGKWDMKPEPLDKIVKVYIPYGHFKAFKDKGIPVDVAYAISVATLSDQDWINVFNLNAVDPVGVLITDVIIELKERKKKYGFEEIFKAIKAYAEADSTTKNAVRSLFAAAESWGLFKKDGTPLNELVKGGQISVLDLSPYAHTAGTYSIRALVVGLVSKRILEERMEARRIEELAEIERGWAFFDVDYAQAAEKVVPLVWVFIDEAHEFLPRTGITPATNALIQVIREGRQPGISMVLATQQPGKIHTDVMTQADILISTRITSRLDIEGLNAVMQSYLPGAITKLFETLPPERGAALVIDDKLEKMYPIQVRPRFTWHGGHETSALKEKKEFLKSK